MDLGETVRLEGAYMLDSHGPGNAVSSGPEQVKFLEGALATPFESVKTMNILRYLLPTRLGMCDTGAYKKGRHKDAEQDVTESHFKSNYMAQGEGTIATRDIAQMMEHDGRHISKKPEEQLELSKGSVGLGVHMDRAQKLIRSRQILENGVAAQQVRGRSIESNRNRNCSSTLLSLGYQIVRL